MGLRKPVRLESQYARPVRRVLAGGVADTRGAIGPLQCAQAHPNLHRDGFIWQRGYGNPRPDLRRVQPGSESDPADGTSHDEVRVPMGARDRLQVEPADEPVY